MELRGAAAVLATALLVTSTPAAAQSLAELARKEADRRATVREPGKVYTNGDLTADFTAPPPAPTPSEAAPAVDEGRAAGAETSGEERLATDVQDGVTPRDQQESQPPSDRGEDYWRSRASSIRARLAAKNGEIEALRQRLASFGAGSVDPEHEVTARALTRAVADLDAFNQEWLRLERQARDEGVPAAWIR